MALWQDIIVTAFLILGGGFGLVGSYGLLKLTSPLARLHAPTKATTLGVGGVLVASMLIQAFADGVFSVHELLVTLFLFLTAPVTALFIAKIHLHQTVSDTDLPPTGTEAAWATRQPDTGP
jgi:multicomponent K+:H+ antiporter subunit G